MHVRRLDSAQDVQVVVLDWVHSFVESSHALIILLTAPVINILLFSYKNILLHFSMDWIVADKKKWLFLFIYNLILSTLLELPI